MPANIQEIQVAISKTAQTAIDTASTDLVRFNSIGDDIADWMPVVEDDADEYGKGHEFGEESFLTSYKVTKKLQYYNSAEAMAIIAAYGLGNGAAGTYTPIDPITNTHEIELPWMTVLEGIRKGGAQQVLDRAFTGMVVDKWSFTLGKGPGRANSRIECDLVGTGRVDLASALAMPVKTPVNLLPAASLTCTINGTDYVTAKTFESAQFNWDNNLRDGYFPGSGFQTPGDPTSGQVMGRMEFGKRKCEFYFVARYQNGSTELTTLAAQTAGTAVLGLTGGAGTSATITFGKCRFKTSKIANTDGIVTVRVDISAQVDATVGLGSLVTIVVNSSLGAVGRP